ncbi:MAG: ribonuclease HII [Zoogloeaceae bacterium]|nr:ribonuclease HII [Zoogloeaceae bacterium]
MALQWLDGLVAGVDEAGRGPLAGPVVAAAVILDPARIIEGLNDSKKLSEAKRDRLAIEIREKALCWSIAEASAEEIDRINILQATFLAMRRALDGLTKVPTLAMIDGNKVPPGLPCAGEAVVKGDGKIAAIAAASILAKTHRDALMRELAIAHPHYGFERHMGYPTAAHFAALEAHGPCSAHRRSFAPVSQLSLL